MPASKHTHQHDNHTRVFILPIKGHVKLYYASFRLSPAYDEAQEHATMKSHCGSDHREAGGGEEVM